ncbi:MAG: hypothetical protein EHM19_04215 [Candidatus Latescibacterota bacterium]|nr:MAG: hypothetical protein EHM19_04215 [Candidatus Latescibacterota bacterium]
MARVPSVLVPAANLAGEAGQGLLASVRRALEARGHPSFEIAPERAPGTARGDPEGAPAGSGLLDRIRREGDASVLLYLSGDERPEDLSVLKNGDTTLLLFGSEVEDLRRAFSLLKELARTEGGTLPVLVPADGRGTAWGRVAPVRLAEAAQRFLGWRLPVWAGTPDEIAAALASRLERMKARREGGIEPLLHRLSLVLGGGR